MTKTKSFLRALRVSVVERSPKKSLAEARLEDSGGGYWFTGILMIFFWIA